jgi:hypothetical protein
MTAEQIAELKAGDYVEHDMLSAPALIAARTAGAVILIFPVEEDQLRDWRLAAVAFHREIPNNT